MTKQNLLVLMLVRFFKNKKKYIFLFSLIFFFNVNNSVSQDKNLDNNAKLNGSSSDFPIVVIDMKKVLSKSTAWNTLQKEMQKLEKSFKADIKIEEDNLKKEQENLKAQKSVISADQFKEKENTFRDKVNKTQNKIENIRRELEATMAKGMQIIQAEAIKHLKKISAESGYLLVLDATSTVIAADKINISDLVAKKLNETLPAINIERKENKKGDK